MSDKNEWREREVGALWKSDNGKFFTGRVTVNGETVKVVAFNNTDKKSDKAPDVNIYVSKDREESKTQSSGGSNGGGDLPPGLE